MNRKFNVSSMIAIIFLIGLVSSFFSSDIQIGEFVNSLELNGIESTLDTINIGLAFVAFAVLFFFLIFRKGSSEQGDRLLRDWGKNREDE